MKKTISIVGIVISMLMFISALVIYIPTFFGLHAMAVNNSDMSPVMMKGSICFTKPIDTAEIKIDDVVGIKNDNGDSLVRRIVRIKPSNSKLLTKGDNLELIDEASLNKDNIIGKTVFSVPVLGFLFTLLSSLVGKIIYGVIFILTLGISIYLLVSKNNTKVNELVSQ